MVYFNRLYYSLYASSEVAQVAKKNVLQKMSYSTLLMNICAILIQGLRFLGGNAGLVGGSSTTTKLRCVTSQKS